MLFIMNIKHSENLFSTLDTDGLVLQLHGINSHNAEYAFMHSQLFMGWLIDQPFNCWSN